MISVDAGVVSGASVVVSGASVVVSGASVVVSGSVTSGVVSPLSSVPFAFIMTTVAFPPAYSISTLFVFFVNAET